MTSPVEIGAVIAGKYRVERVLGQGGMGVVVVAMHDDLDQRVAIKFLLPEAVRDADWVARFSREAKAAAKIKSEHVVRVFDVGRLDNGAPYMVMEYLDGKDLQTLLGERSRLPPQEAIEYVLQACEALAEAHAVGIVHRDLKPANLFVTHRTDGSPCVKILDFGISKVTDATGVSVTSTTAIVGSPLYMSPEQMKASKNVDRRSDIWSLGILLQELLTGTPSFNATTSAELCALVLTSSPTPLRETLPTASPDLEAIIHKCLEKDPSARYQNVGELAFALAPLSPGSHVSLDRIARLAPGASGARPSLVSIENPPTPAVVPPPAPSGPGLEISAGATISASSLAPSQQAISGVGATQQSLGVAGTAAAWGSATKAPVSPARYVVAGAAALLLVGLGVGAFVVVRGHGDGGAHVGTSTATSASTSASTSTSPATSTSASTSTSPATVPASATDSAQGVPIGALPTVKPHATASVAGSVKAPVASAHPSSSVKTPPVNTTGFGGRN